MEKILSKSKRIVIYLLLAFMFLGLLAMPVLAKSSSWSMKLSYKCRVVDGSANGKYHSLSAGYAKINGSVYPSYVAPGATTPQTLTFQLKNKTSGNSFGRVTVTPYAKKNKAKSFSSKYDKKVGGGTKYYLFIYRGVEDGRTIIGNGTLANTK